MSNNDDESVEPLSIATFDPVYAREPYLNTPRSLAACRFHGVNPEELVEIPFREFQRAYPDDPETALRRFERVDGARKRVLDEVVRKWQEICKEEKKHSRKSKRLSAAPSKETVMKVDSDQHVTVLEMQAEQFRRVEQQQWRSLQASLFMEMKKAVNDQQAKQIQEKQDGNEAEVKRRKRQHELEVEAQHRRERERQLQKEKEMAEEHKRAQKLYLENVYKKQEQDKINSKKAKQAQLRREMDKLHREEMLNRQKEENFQRYQAEANERSRQVAAREKEIAERMQFEKKKHDDEMRRKRDKHAEKLQTAKEELARMEQERAEALSNRINSFDQKWHDKRIQKQREHKEHLEAKGDNYLEKIRTIREASDAVINEKIERTKSELEQKEEAARLELERAEQQRERRRQIKEVRQESFQLAAARRKKAEENRKRELEESIRRKNERYDIIKTGKQTLRQLTDSMEEVVSKTRAEIRYEVERLNSKDMLTTDNVMDRVKKHSDTVLFPRLESRFGDKQDGEDEEDDWLAQTAPANMEKNKSSSSRPNTTQSTRGTKTGTLGRAQTAMTPTRVMPLKIFKKEALDDSLSILKNNVVKRSSSPASTPPKTWSAPNSSPAKKSQQQRQKQQPKKKVEKKESFGMDDNDDDEWFQVEDEEEEKARGDEEGEGEDDFNPDGGNGYQERANTAGSPNRKQLSRKATPFPSDIERDAQKSNDFNRVEPSFSEDEEMEDGKKEHRLRVQSFQSSRKDTPFPEQIAAAVNGSGKNSRSISRAQTPAIEESGESGEGFMDDEGYNDTGRDESDYRLQSSQSAPCGNRSESFSRTGTNSSRPSTQDRNTRLRPLTPDGSFRKEYSSDHPLNGGKGKYSREKAAGKKEIQPKDYGTGGKKQKKKYERVAEVVSKQEQKKMDLQRKLEALRKHQNDALLEVLEEERQAEDARNSMGRSVKDVAERNRLELVFAEERKRASERIISMTKDHEKKMKDVILAMDLGS